MANRAPDRYSLPPELGNRDTTMWVAGKPFFLASAIKYIWRGWDHPDDLRKAIDCLELAYVHEADLKASFSLMASDLPMIGGYIEGRREWVLFQLVKDGKAPNRERIFRCLAELTKRVKELGGEKG